MADLTAKEIIDLDPAKKGKAFCMARGKQIYRNYTSGTGQNFFRQKAQWKLNSKYAMGRQPINIYKKLLGRDTTINYDHLNFAVTKIMPKIFDILIGMMSRIDVDVQCDAIDPSSCEEKLRNQYRREAETMLRNQIQEIERETGMTLQDAPAVYESIEELQMDLEAGNLKLDFEIAVEELIATVFNFNNIEELRLQLTRDMANCGMGILRHYVLKNGLIKIRRVDPLLCVSNFVTSRDFRDMSECGEEVFMSIHELRECAGDEFDEETYYKIAISVANKYNNPSMASYATLADCYITATGGYIYDKFTVRVFDAEFTTTDRYAHTVGKPNKYGNKETREKKANYKPSERSEKYTKYTDYKVWYGVKWIIGTDFCYGYGKVQFPNVAVNALNESKSTFAVHALHIEDMITQTLTERCIEFMDDIVLSFVQMQSYTAKATPPGVAVDSSAISNVPKGKGKTWEPLEMISYYTKTGNLISNMLLPNGQFMQRLPILELQGSDLNKVTFWFNKMIQGIDMIKMVMGLNDYTDASNPNPEQNQLGMRAALEGTNNSLQPLITALDGVIIKTAEGVVNRAQKMASMGQLDYLANAIGRNDIRVLGFSGEVSAAVFGMKMTPRMTAQEQAWLNENIQASLAQRSQNGVGGIEMEDAMAIRRYKNLKHAEKTLTMRRRKRAKEDEEKSIRIQQQNAQVQTQSAMAVEQMKQQTMQIEFDLYQKKKFEVDLPFMEKEIQLKSAAKQKEILVQTQAELEKETQGKIVDEELGLNEQPATTT